MHPKPHSTHEAVRDLHELERVADVGQDDRTPLILIWEMWVVSAILVGVILALSLFAFHVAT